jgi:hypothetical protein
MRERATQDIDILFRGARERVLMRSFRHEMARFAKTCQCRLEVKNALEWQRKKGKGMSNDNQDDSWKTGGA